MTQYTLYVKPSTDVVGEYYKSHKYYHEGDSGYDLFVLEDIEFKPYETKFVNFQIQCEMVETNNLDKNVSYYLYPRSSISKTPLILANSVGIIDAGYRGDIIAALRYIPFENSSEKYTLKKDTRIVQLCSPTLAPLSTKIVDVLSISTRGAKGFGSTGI